MSHFTSEETDVLRIPETSQGQAASAGQSWDSAPGVLGLRIWAPRYDTVLLPSLVGPWLWPVELSWRQGSLDGRLRRAAWGVCLLRSV